MNYMAEVAKMLGVELGEEFDIVFKPPSSCTATAMITESDFVVLKHNIYILNPYWKEYIFMDLVRGTCAIKHKPWKPKEDEPFFLVGYDGKIRDRYWEECTAYQTYYKLGNCYKTRSDAEANRDKWVAFYASDEVLEV